MNLVEKLLRTDAKKVDELSEAVIASKKLGKALGEESVDVKIRELPAKRMNDLMAMQFDNKGNFSLKKNFDVKALVVAEAMVEPDLKSKELQEHFSCSTSKDLAIKLFGNELTMLSDEVAKLSGMEESVEEIDEEVKN